MPAIQQFNMMAAYFMNLFLCTAHYFEIARSTILYDLAYLYVKLRWRIYCATGHWGFDEEKRNTPENPTVLPVPDEQPVQQEGQISLYEHLRRLRIQGYQPVPGQVRYLGQFVYESWNDRRWNPKESDYDADDEAEDD